MSSNQNEVVCDQKEDDFVLIFDANEQKEVQDGQGQSECEWSEIVEEDLKSPGKSGGAGKWQAISGSGLETMSVASSSNQSGMTMSLTMQLSPNKRNAKRDGDAQGQAQGEARGSQQASDRVPFSWAEIAKVQPTFECRPVQGHEPGAPPVQMSLRVVNENDHANANAAAPLQVRRGNRFAKKRKQKKKSKLVTIPESGKAGNPNAFEDVHATKADFGRTARRVGKAGSRVKRLGKRNQRGKKATK